MNPSEGAIMGELAYVGLITLSALVIVCTHLLVFPFWARCCICPMYALMCLGVTMSRNHSFTSLGSETELTLVTVAALAGEALGYLLHRSARQQYLERSNEREALRERTEQLVSEKERLDFERQMSLKQAGGVSENPYIVGRVLAGCGGSFRDDISSSAGDSLMQPPPPPPQQQQQILFSTTSVADLVQRHRHKQFRAIIPAIVCATGLHLALTVGPQPTDQSTFEYEIRLIIAVSNACGLLIGGLTMTIADDRRAHATLVRLNELNNAMTCAAVVFMTKYRYQDMSVWMEVSAQPVHYCRATAVLRLACPLLSL
jgi:hypothetical protein